MQTMNKEIFRAYDIRGIVPSPLDEKMAFLIGRAFSKLMHRASEKTLCVARDARLSGERLEKAFIDGLIQSGIHVVELGILPTPVLYFATFKLDYPNGVIVTASHNPGHYNGFKFVLQQKPLLPEQIQQMYQIIQTEDFLTPNFPGTLTHRSVEQDYLDTIASQIHLKRPLKIVVDAGNGVTAQIAPALYRRLGCEVVELYCTLDGNFPNHHPDPSRPENLAVLQEKVLEERADLGLAFDGDGDRLGVVTNQSEIIWPDRLLMLLAQEILKTQRGAKIVFDVKCSSHLPRLIQAAGGEPVMWRTGHSFIKLKIKECDAALAGEMSGHIFYNDRWFGVDDALYTGARLLEILSAQPKSCHAIFAEIPTSANTPEINIAIADTEKFTFLEKLMRHVQGLDAHMITIDGIRLEFKQGWALIRASNTSPVLVLRFEADNLLALKEIQALIKNLLIETKPDLVIPF